MVDFRENLMLGSAVAPNFFVMHLLGIWPTKTSTRLYKTYAVIITSFVFFLYIISELVNIVISFGDLELITQASFLFLTHMAQLVKLYFFGRYRNRIQSLTDSLERRVFQPRNGRQLVMVKRSMRRATVTYYVLISMSIATCSLWAVFPMIEVGENGMELPLSAYYPFSTDLTIVFNVIFAYQILSTAINAATNVSMDTTTSGFMSLVCGQLDILNDSLIHVKDFAEEQISSDRSISLDAAMEENLVHCVDHHRNILQMTEEIGTLFGITTLSQFAAGAIIICITMFELTLVSLFSIKFVSMVLYQGCILVEILVYCWFGNEIILRSSKIANSAYHSDWTDSPTSYKRKLLLIMTRSRVPIKLYAGNFFTLSLETFMTILRTSWSYFAVLNRVHQD
ncbi:PREDICTED: odorant receptor Or1-like [Nicrophorus vespilloides]|uniref:Odorant receptor n=1 Tax=Nicrophorus vespilloides TaxID=110193 RepID=A0ABM1NF51_NICVS|nr:PREDICTED: odorant receptor Or1-like [Nicrophorus vespilloides]